MDKFQKMTELRHCERRKGLVLSVKGCIAQVRLIAETSSDCDACALSGSCAKPNEKKSVETQTIRAQIPPGRTPPSVGEEVILHSTPNATAKAATWLLLLPLILFMGSMVICSCLGFSELNCATISSAVVGIFWIIYLFASRKTIIWTIE